MVEFTCDNNTILKNLKDNIQTSINYDKFFSGVVFTCAKITDIDIKMLGCWNSDCQQKLDVSHKDSVQQAKLNDMLNQYDALQVVRNKFRFFFGDNIYYTKDEKKIIKDKKKLDA